MYDWETLDSFYGPGLRVWLNRNNLIILNQEIRFLSPIRFLQTLETFPEHLFLNTGCSCSIIGKGVGVHPLPFVYGIKMVDFSLGG